MWKGLEKILWKGLEKIPNSESMYPGNFDVWREMLVFKNKEIHKKQIMGSLAIPKEIFAILKGTFDI